MATTINYPEMWGNSEAEITATSTCITSRPYSITSKQEIKISRTIEFTGLVGEYGANNCKNKRVGWFKYLMTRTAFDKFAKTNNVTIECLLD